MNIYWSVYRGTVHVIVYILYQKQVQNMLKSHHILMNELWKKAMNYDSFKIFMLFFFVFVIITAINDQDHMTHIVAIIWNNVCCLLEFAWCTFVLSVLLMQERMETATRQTIKTTVRFVNKEERSFYVTPVPEHITLCVWIQNWKKPLRENGAAPIVWGNPILHHTYTHAKQQTTIYYINLMFFSKIGHNGS